MQKNSKEKEVLIESLKSTLADRGKYKNDLNDEYYDVLEKVLNDVEKEV